MVKALVTSDKVQEREALVTPVTADEFEPEALAEILRRVEQMRRGEDTVFSNEEVLRDLDPELVRIAELLDELS